jgi:serine/threonine protein kinase
MEEHGEAKVSIVDFGIAKDRNRATQLTRITDAAGSPQYMPPVVYQIEAKNDNSKYALVDIYEMGIVFYELLTGKNPFAQMDENTYKQFLAKPESIPLDFSEIRESDMLAVVRKMMSNRPQDNFQSMQEVIDALEGKVKLAPPVVAPVGYKAPAPAPAPAAPGDSTRLSGLSTVQDALPMDGIDIDKREQVIDYLSALQKELAKRSSLDKGDYLLIDAHLGRILEKYAADEDILDILGMIQIKLTRVMGKGGVK